MSAELIYRTSSPAAEIWWRHLKEMQQQQDELRRAFEDEMLDTYGPADVPDYQTGYGKRLLYTNGRGITGLDSGYREQPPTGSGWRLDAKDHIWKPALKEAAGRKLKSRLQALTVYVWQNHTTEIGIPELIFADAYLCRPGLTADEEPFVLYQTWGSGRCEADCRAEQARHPEVVWTEVPRSEWYARIEAQEQVAS
jgi:hypothetical protein